MMGKRVEAGALVLKRIDVRPMRVFRSDMRLFDSTPATPGRGILAAKATRMRAAARKVQINGHEKKSSFGHDDGPAVVLKRGMRASPDIEAGIARKADIARERGMAGDADIANLARGGGMARERGMAGNDDIANLEAVGDSDARRLHPARPGFQDLLHGGVGL
jgi:hypothetical protein